MSKDRRTKVELLRALEVLARKHRELSELHKTSTLEHVDKVEGLNAAHKREVTDLQVKTAILERENNRLEKQLMNEVATSLRMIAYFDGKADGVMAALKAITGTDGVRRPISPPDSPPAAEDLFDDEDPDDPAY